MSAQPDADADISALAGADSAASYGSVDTSLRLVAFDLDGVLHRGGVVLPGAVEALDEVRRRGLQVRYVTNNATKHRDSIAAHLQSMGIPADTRDVFSSASATAAWLAERYPAGTRVLVVGEEGLRRELTDAGLVADYAGDPALGEPGTPESAPGSYAAVVVGLDRGFTYAGLARAHASVRAGALFVATNLDVTLPADGRILPGAGAVVAAVAAATGQEPVAIGKPNLRLADALAASSGFPAGRTLFVGDRLDTDITFGVQAGMHTALVLTGVSHREDLVGSEVQPDVVLESLLDFPALLDELAGGTE